METQLLTLLRMVRAWMCAVLFFVPALAFAQVYGEDAARYSGRGWGFWNGFWTIAAIVAILVLAAWGVSTMRGRRRVGP
ncbi:hypothetical protein JQX13_38060 [Archangium violaceum]|uniref:hypothetical protein n=1 Tax=Archangium violaceum TaxID=83451 RepID=UPI00193C0937|nr:hypothetical protein [Archangium violaceum]QRK05902.1 hypothetical protein JQX13_38060 [Archangium violaceum]